jgi:hypothetical protein
MREGATNSVLAGFPKFSRPTLPVGPAVSCQIVVDVCFLTVETAGT